MPAPPNHFHFKRARYEKIILPALLAFGCLTAAQFAAADNDIHRQDREQQMQHAGYCTERYGNHLCVDHPRNGGYDSWSAPYRVIELYDFSALAAAPNRVFAVSNGHTAREARQAALNRCREKGGRNCRAMVTRNGCLSVAMGKDARGDTLYFFGSAKHRSDAREDALNQCKTGRYKECRISDEPRSFVCASLPR